MHAGSLSCRNMDLKSSSQRATETVLIAEYDGSERKDYRDIQSPAIRGSTATPGMVSFMTSKGIPLRSALDSLARDQKIMIINNTGIEDKTILTREVANFKTDKGMELAEQWYKRKLWHHFSQRTALPARL